MAGLTADLFGIKAAIWLVATITLCSGLIVAIRMTETLPPKKNKDYSLIVAINKRMANTKDAEIATVGPTFIRIKVFTVSLPLSPHVSIVVFDKLENSANK